jgi:RNA polymerase sigma-70 factor (family 1)
MDGQAKQLNNKTAIEYSNQQLVNEIQQGNMAVFEFLYKKYYVFLCLIAGHIVRNPNDAEDIVSDVFVKLWNIRYEIEITTSIKAYLIKAVQNTSINYLKRSKSNDKVTNSFISSAYEILAWKSDYQLGQLYEKDIIEILDKGIESLPEGCRQIFLLSRNEEMKYSDIASKLGITVNTVKTQMKIALARLRETLKDYMCIFL